MGRRRSWAASVGIVVLVLSGCATEEPPGDPVSSSAAPTMVAPPTSAESGDAQPTIAPPSPEPPPVAYTDDSLAGTAWILDSLNGAPPLEGSIITLRFLRGGGLTGSAGCNYYGTDVVEGPGTMSLGEMTSTAMLCTGPLGEQENKFLQSLQRVMRWEVNDDRLELTGEAGTGSLVFSAQPREISGTAWTIDSYASGMGGTSSVLKDSIAEVTFSTDGIVSGNAGCNDMRAEYTASGGELEIGSVAMTEMGCFEPEGLLQQERAIAEALEASVTYRVEGNRLFSYAADGSMLLVLLSAP